MISFGACGCQDMADISIFHRLRLHDQPICWQHLWLSSDSKFQPWAQCSSVMICWFCAANYSALIIRSYCHRCIFCYQQQDMSQLLMSSLQCDYLSLLARLAIAAACHAIIPHQPKAAAHNQQARQFATMCKEGSVILNPNDALHADILSPEL